MSKTTIYHDDIDKIAKEEVLELDKYRAFVCAVETGSLSAAADKLQYTPSGVSRMIAALEEEKGFSLLFRNHNGVSLTQEGKKILPAVRDLLHAEENCNQISEQIKGIETGTVVIGTAYSSFYSILAKVVSDFHKEHPGIRVRLCSGYSTELLNKLNSHMLDLCIISKREGEHSWFKIMEDEMMAWIPKKHSLAKLSAIPLTEFERESYIETYPNQDIDNARIFKKCKISPNLKFSTMDSMATYSMVEAGLGISMNNAINGRLWSGNVCIKPLKPKQKIEIGIATLQKKSPIVNTFFSFMKSYLQL